eukprot:13740550-Alexandrium_andersonii.AAC.1
MEDAPCCEYGEFEAGLSRPSGRNPSLGASGLASDEGPTAGPPLGAGGDARRELEARVKAVQRSS